MIEPKKRKAQIPPIGSYYCGKRTPWKIPAHPIKARKKKEVGAT